MTATITYTDGRTLPAGKTNTLTQRGFRVSSMS